MQPLNDRRSLIPDSIRFLLDGADESLRKRANLEVVLQCVSHLFQRALIIPEQEQAETTREQEVVDANLDH